MTFVEAPPFIKPAEVVAFYGAHHTDMRLPYIRMQDKGKYLLNNHLRFNILFHRDELTDLARIVGFEVGTNAFVAARWRLVNSAASAFCTVGGRGA